MMKLFLTLMKKNVKCVNNFKNFVIEIICYFDLKIIKLLKLK